MSIRITNAHKYYHKGKSNQLHVMDDINLELPDSGMIAIFGKSGCGKTTLLNAIGGLDTVASGSIELFGRNIREDTDTVRNRYIGYIFQNYNLQATETVYENVANALRLCGMQDENAIEARVQAALLNVDMAKYRDRTPDTLSGGQQQRVAIARALVKNPAIILADEPTGNLDETNTVMVMDILKEISRTHLVLLVTHEANLVDFYCDRVIEIVDGHVESDRRNAEANGYIQRNKNDIYLGELEHRETAAPGVTVAYYGEPTDPPISLTIVHVGGKLYLKTENTVKLLDDGSEIKLKPGVFQETPRDGALEHGVTANGRRLDMSVLTPVEGEHYGRLYHWKNALAVAWRENFAKKNKKKRGRALLRLCLVMLSIVMVFMTALIGAYIRSYADYNERHSERIFYIPLLPDTDYSAVVGEMGKHGMAFSGVIGSDPEFAQYYLHFNTSPFMTADPVNLNATGHVFARSHCHGMKVVAGDVEVLTDSDIILTTAMADALLETSTLGYMDSYGDLIGLVNSNANSHMGYRNLRIAAVVESEENCFYLDDLVWARFTFLNSSDIPVVPLSMTAHKEALAPGEVLVNAALSGNSDFRVGETITVMGLPLTVKEILTNSVQSIEQYADYVYNTYGETIIADPRRYEGNLYEWLFEHYGRYIGEFYRLMLDERPSDWHVTEFEWLLAEKNSVFGMLVVLSDNGVYDFDHELALAADMYHKEYGHWPDDQTLKEYFEKNGLSIDMLVQSQYELIDHEYSIYLDNRYYASENRINAPYVITDQDYITLAGMAGVTDDKLDIFTYETFGDEEWRYYSHHLLIHSDDPEATEAFLVNTLGTNAIITPAKIFAKNMEYMRTDLLIGVVGILIILALMCLCVYFIMRSSFMSRVREVGILRAIGVTRKNLVFRFAVETALLVTLTLLLGYLISSWFILSLADAPFFSELFYFPLWLCTGLLIVILAAALLFGILPALVLLRRTPSAILSKYDI